MLPSDRHYFPLAPKNPHETFDPKLYPFIVYFTEIVMFM